ncbi:hypothetical protein [Methanothermococcus okinawensis]|uniref:hypothetical protein n=1 Tax=Methanothermococcus okinawensis TaxID=155863 RepID=UPI00064E84F7|nr:hypothetical protein [Methanothermococcus okinawensis]
MNEYQKQYMATLLLIEIILLLLKEFRAALVCIPIFIIILALFHEQLFHGISLDNIKLFKKDSFNAHKRVKSIAPINSNLPKEHKQKEGYSKNNWY